MLGIDYESSDEEVSAPIKQPEVSRANPAKKGAIATNIKLLNSPATVTATATASLSTSTEEHKSPPGPKPGPVDGPSQGPSIPLELDQDDTIDAPPGSPYTSNRLAVQNLTLPTVPNWDIPPSPPGSPPQKATKKFTQFLELKKKGQHFNSRLETSSVLRDPNHLQKLSRFAGLTESDQYLSSLPDELGVPAVWPSWAYGDELNAVQKKMKANTARGAPKFVPAKPGASAPKSTLSVRAAQDGAENSRKRKVVD